MEQHAGIGLLPELITGLLFRNGFQILGHLYAGEQI
jgi:hypothetical protein